METLYSQYQKTFVKQLQDKLSKKNVMAVPKLVKITVNMGVKDAVSDKKSIEKMAQALAVITGQKPKIARAKKSIATFKVREGDEIGLLVTLRGKRMYDFFERLVKVVLPRLKDFHGVKKTSFDGKGNYTLGFIEYSVFPEIDLATVEKMQGMEVSFVTTSVTNEEGFILLETLGMPFRKETK
ncbi:MAG TPA: 50S ribosomal protein L5 [Patescibacteria group bacterium]|nr:50S ribosomal protein L5 [Patescibacteria group bacterium]